MKKERTITFSAVLEKSTNRLWGAHVAVPATAARQLAEGTQRRVICSIGGSRERQCALLPIGDATFVITVNKNLRDTLGLGFGDRVQLTIRRDNSKYGLPMPAELEELLRQDKGARLLFQTLTPGKRRTLLHIVGSVRDPDRRLHRANIIVRHLITNDGQIKYRELHTALKRH